MKYLMLLLSFTFFLSADYLNTKDKNHCAYDVEPNQNKKGLCYTDRNSNRDECNKKLTYDDLIDGYNLVDGKCVLKNDLEVTGLTQYQWNTMMMILSNIVGFTMLFLVSFLATLIARK